jgi:X-X-X-Leu-X-X-Gly heptad repeat protein
MRLVRRFSLFGLALLLFAGVSCTSSDSSPAESLGPSVEQQQQSPSFGLIGDLTDGLGDLTDGVTDLTSDLTGTAVGTLGSVTDLLTCSTQPYAITSQTIGPEGGYIRVGSHTLVIPGNAVSERVRITAEQLPGKTNSVRFSPDGLQFEKPAVLTMSYENCALVLLQKKIVYTTEQLKILEVLKSFDLFRSKKVSAPIDHFSRYAIAY